jgi:hypothetical protein
MTRSELDRPASDLRPLDWLALAATLAMLVVASVAAG